MEEPSCIVRCVMASPAASTAVSSRTPSGDYLTRAARAEKQIRELLLDSNFHFSNAPGVSMSASEVGGRGVRTERPCVPPAAGANYFTMYIHTDANRDLPYDLYPYRRNHLLYAI